MLQKKISFILLIILTLSLANAAFMVDENVFVGDEDESVLAFGSSVNFLGNVDAPQLVAAGTIHVDENAELKSDSIMVGNSVRIDGNHEKSITVIANDVVVGEDALIEGDVLITATNVVFEGRARGNVRINSNKLIYSGHAMKDLVVSSDSVFTQSEAIVDGEFILSTDLYSGEAGTFANGITGDQPGFSSQAEAFRNALSVLIFGLVLIWFASKTHRDISVVYKYNLNRSFIYGLMTLIIVPLFIVLLWLSGISNILAMLLASVFTIMLLIGIFLGTLRLGHFVLDSFGLVDNAFFSYLAGLFILFFLRYVPYLGGLLAVVVFVIGVGMAKKMLINRFDGTPVFRVNKRPVQFASSRPSYPRVHLTNADRKVKKRTTRKAPAKAAKKSTAKRATKKTTKKVAKKTTKRATKTTKRKSTRR